MYFYVAFSNAAYPVGPLLGFGLAAVFLDLPENLKGDFYYHIWSWNNEIDII